MTAETPSDVPPSYAHALERLRAERDALEAEVDRLRAMLSPPADGSSVRASETSVQADVIARLQRMNTAFDLRKPRPDLIPAEALLEAGACMADRVDRDDGLGPWYDRAPLSETLPKYRGSLLRHVLAYYADERVDPHSNRSPLAHVIVNASILYRLENRAITFKNAKES